MKNANKLLACLGVTIACFAGMSQSAYAAVAGHVQFVNGSLQITNSAGQTRQAQKGDAVSEGDTVTSAPSASAQIRMQDGGFVAMRPDTKLKFDQFVFAGKQDGSEKSFFSLFKGGFRAVTGLIGQINKQNYRITTPAATIGIRGTDHETFLVVPGSPLAQIAPTGAYSKVNVGETSLTTDKGTINVLPNQMGFAGGMNQAPQVQPVNTKIFTVAEAPTPQGKADKKEEKKEGKAEAKQEEKVAKGDKEGKKEDKKEAQTDAAASTGSEGQATGTNAAAGENQDASGGSTSTTSTADGDSTGGTAQGATAAAAPADTTPAPAPVADTTPLEPAAPIRSTAVVDAVPPSAELVPAVAPVTAPPVAVAPVIAPPPAPTTVLDTATVAGGTTVNIITGTATTNTGQTVPVTQGLYASQAQAAADAALLAANAAATAVTAVQTASTQVTALLPVDTAPASAAIGTANPLVASAATTYSSVSVITPVDTVPAVSAINAATTDIGTASPAVSAANGLAPVATTPADAAIATANTNIGTASPVVSAANGLAPVATTPATTAIGTANTNIGAATPAVTTATALTPVNATTATANATAAAAQATAAAAQATAAQSALTANGVFADTTAAPALAAAQVANTTLQAANTAVQGAVTTVGTNNANLTAAQTAAQAALTAATNNLTTANTNLATATTQNAALTAAQTAAQAALTAATNNLTTANTNLATATTQNAALTAAQTAAQNALANAQANLTTANTNLATATTQNAALTAAQTAAQAALNAAQANLTAANTALSTASAQNTTITAAQVSVPTQLTAAQTAAAAAQAAAAAAQAAAAQAATLQAAGDMVGAQAQLTIAQNELAIAQQQQAAATAAQTAATTALTDAQTAQTTGLANVNNAVTAATAAQTAANTVTTQAALVAPAAAAASTALAAVTSAATTATTDAATASTQAAAAQSAVGAAGTAVTDATTAANAAATDAATAQTQAGAAQTAASTATTAVTTAATAANTAATDAGTASAQAAAAQTASTDATTALADSTANLATVNTNAPLVATNAQVAAYNNPAVVTPDRFVGIMSTIQPDAMSGYIEGYGPGVGFNGIGTANTSFVLDGAGNLVEKRHAWYEETAASYGMPQLVVADANVKRSGGTAVETFKMADNSIYAGRWVGGSLTVTDNAVTAPVPTFTRNLGLTSEHWAILLAPPPGHVQTLGGSVNYTRVAATSPTDVLGIAGTLNTATLAANFTAQLVDATLNLSIAGKTLDVVATAMVISGNFFSTTTQVTAGCTGCGAATYYANVGGGFAGDLAASAGLNYTLWSGAAPGAPTGATDLIQGLVAFSADTTPVVAPVVTAPYVATNTAVAYTGAYGGGFNFIAMPGDISPAGNPTSFTENYGDGSGFRTDTLTGASTGTPPTTVTTTGGTSITYGVWETVTTVNSSEQHLIRPNQGGSTLPNYMYGQQGYLDSAVTYGTNTGPLAGTFTYNPVATTSFMSDTWATGTVTTAVLTANFTNQMVSIMLAGTMGPNSWDMNGASPINIMNPTNGAGAQFIISTPAITMNASPCTTCVGNINGAFVGQNYAGAIVEYGVYDNSPLTGMNAGGLVAFDRMPVVTNPVVTNSAPNPTGVTVVANAWQQVNDSSNPATTDGAGVLTGWGGPGWSNTVTPAAGSLAQTPVGTGSGTINWGLWGAGSIINNSFSYTPGPGQLHWITAPEPTPVYLAEVLTTTVVYNLVNGGVTGNDMLGGWAHGTIGSASLTANFTTQTIAANLALTAHGHSWVASTANAPLQYVNNSNSLTSFYADSFRLPFEPGYLTVTVDGAPANGSLAGQLVGAALDGALLKFNLDGQVATPTMGHEWAQGAVALQAAAANDPATPYRMVVTSLSDPMALVPTVQIGGSYNNAARVITDVSGNLMQFDDNSGGGSGTVIQLASGTFNDMGSAVIGGATVSWGRWASDTVINVQDRATGIWQNGIALTSGAHAVVGPLMTGPVALPTTGVYGYTLVGATTPTTDTGAVGTLNSTLLQANFTMQTVNVGVNVTAGGATLDASAAGVPIQNRAMFFADSRVGTLTVNCTGACGTTNHAAIGGGFGGAAGAGAAITYGFEKGGINAGTVSGVAVFQQGAVIP